MRFSTFSAFAVLALSTLATMTNAQQIAPQRDISSAGDQREELSQEQISIGLRLAGREFHNFSDRSACDISAGRSIRSCNDGKYSFWSRSPDAVTVYLQDRSEPDVSTTVALINSSTIYIKADLDPKEARSISVELAELILSRKLNDIDPNDPDTFYNPRDLDLMALFYRATDKVQRKLVGETCNTESEAIFLAGRPTPCTYGPFFIRKTGEYEHTLFTRDGNRSVVTGHFGGGWLDLDATISDADKINKALEFIEATLSIERERVTGIPQRINKTAPDPRFAKVAAEILVFASDKKCDREASGDYLMGTSTNCEVAGYFFERVTDSEYHVRMRNEPNTTNLALKIKGGKPFLRFTDLGDKPFIDTNNVVPELDIAFSELSVANGK